MTKTMNRILLTVTIILLSQSFYSQTTIEILEELNSEYKKADKELNRVYKKLRKSLDDKGKELLLTSQRAWLKYRDSNAEFISDRHRGGSLQKVERLGLLVDMTKARVKELKGY